MNFENSIEFLKENDMPIILTKEDQYIDDEENIKRGHHSFTEYSKNEQIIENANIVVSVFEIIKDNKLVNNDEDMRSIYKQLNEPWKIKISNGESSVSKDSFKSIIEEALGENNKGRTLLYEKLKKHGINISKYESLLDKISDEEKERFPDVLQKCTLVAIEESMSKKIENNEKIEER